MATPASNQQSYTAGTCRLDVTSQLSALSQWSARPMVSALTFQLWLEQSGQPVLVARGDRTDLQALSSYVQDKTRRLLTVAVLNTERRSPDPDSQPPTSLQLSQPLSYLQLCDLNTVLTQHDQSAQTLPVALPAIAAEKDAADNVVSFSAARHRASSAVRAPRRRQNRMVWASSAAAALFAIGLTSTLWSRDPALQQSAIESAVPESETNEFEAQLESALEAPQSVESEDSDDVADTLPESPTANNEQPTVTRPQTSTPPSVQPSPSRSSAPQDVAVVPAPAPSAPAPARSPSGERLAAPSNLSEGNDLAEPVLPPSPTPTPEPQSTTEEISPAEAAPSSPSAPAQSAPTPAQSEATDSTVTSSPGRVPRRAVESFAVPPDPALTAGDESQQITIESEGDLRSNGVRSPASISQRTVPPQPAADSLGAASMSEAAITGTLDQVQAYFQSRWQTSEENSLRYELQLSAEGEVVSFVGLDDVSQAQRNRILPADVPPPIFPRPSTADTDSNGSLAPLSLRIVLQPDGLVQVTAF